MCLHPSAVSLNFGAQRRGAALDAALHAIALAIGFHRLNRVVIGCPMLEAVHAHSGDGIGMARVQPDWESHQGCCWPTSQARSRGLPVRSLVLTYPDARGLIGRRTHLRGRWG
jgi:hypothetical protein